MMFSGICFLAQPETFLWNRELKISESEMFINKINVAWKLKTHYLTDSPTAGRTILYDPEVELKHIRGKTVKTGNQAGFNN